MASNPALEAVVSTIRSLHQQQNLLNTSNYVEICNALDSNLDLLNENHPENLLPIFTLPEYTLPHIYVLYCLVKRSSEPVPTQSPNATAPVANTSAPATNQEKLLNDVENCILLADYKQIECGNFATDVYNDICHYFTKRLITINKPKRGLPVLRNAIKSIQTDSNTNIIKKNKLTSVHSDLLQLSLGSKNFTMAFDLLGVDILDIHKPHNVKFESKFLLGYFYYGGCIYGAMKQYDSALFFFEQALTVPAFVLSQIMIESYKKFILISLICKGKLLNLPKYTSRLVINQIKPLCANYHELASAFTNFDSEKLTLLCQKYQSSFEADKNTGLIKQLQHSFYKKNIQKLTKTFITLSLSDMALKVKLSSAKEAEIYMLNMIKDRDIFATINQKDGMVSFHDNPEKYNNPQIMESLTQKMFGCIQMDSNIKEMDKEIITHPHYIQKCQSISVVDDNIDSLQSTNISSIRQQSSSNLGM